MTVPLSAEAGWLLPALSGLTVPPAVPPTLTAHWAGWLALAIFLGAYLLAMAEEITELRKSKPVVLGAGIIWALIGGYYALHGETHAPDAAFKVYLLEYAELMLYLLVVMVYVNAMQERRVFDAVEETLARRGYSYRRLFWVTGTLAFVVSPLAANLTTALLLCAVVLAVGRDNRRFVLLACINIVVAANAGGVFSPLGDITTLLVWQEGLVDFWGFFALALPAALGFLIPAACMHFALPRGAPVASRRTVTLRRGARRIVLLFLLSTATAAAFDLALQLPLALGMLTGLGYLQVFGFYLRMSARRRSEGVTGPARRHQAFDIFETVARVEWDTILFFYGVVLCVGGLAFIGYLGLASELVYGSWGATAGNLLIGLVSAVVDNIPIMYAVLSMEPAMTTGQWLLVTLAAGVGGSLLSIGSAAGVAVMGQARGTYTFLGHLRWTPAIALGFAASVFAHLWLNQALF